MEQEEGYKKIYRDLLKDLAKIDIAGSCAELELVFNAWAEAEIPFMGFIYKVSSQGVRRADGQKFYESIGSGLIHYLKQACKAKAAGQFVTFATLAGPLFKQGGYSASALEHPVVKRFEGRVPELLAIAERAGGRVGGEAGMGSVSLIFELLPHIPVQLIFYERDDEFPVRATLLFDRNATCFLEFEFLAVLVTIFVHRLCS
ncbi:MAG: DUF3786 domain-containing protein [Desulfobacteraceae bacterium]|nr:DUF3786 domain-containing protein [Desulfobacteraceae bacterium]MBU4053557.1 DUF3786 domain-containing protein [Pseudomonadota bacterium]